MVGEQELLDDLKEVATAVEGSPSANDYREHGSHSINQFYDHFGSWGRAKEMAEVDGKVIRSDVVRREDVIEDIRKVSNAVEGVPTKGEYEEHGEFSAGVIYRLFDSWPEARKEAGIDGKPTPENAISTDELIAELVRLAEKLGHPPRRREMEEIGEFSGSAYRREFGSWNAALKAADLEVNQPTNAEKIRVECYWCGAKEFREKAQIEDQRHVFCSRDCKAEFQASDEWGGEDHPLSDRVERECDWCGETIRRKPSIAKERNHHFCDYDCLGNWASENRTGEGSPRWKGGGNLYYGENWQSQRRKRREIDDYTCQRCGMTEEESKQKYGRQLSVHHRRPVREFVRDGSPDYEAINSLSNLVTLCLVCHREIEKLPVQPQFD